MFSMLMLVLGNNYVVMFIGWEGVGLCSYLLIGYYFDQAWRGRSGQKAFVVNRIGDAGILIGDFSGLCQFRTLDYTQVFAHASQLSTEHGDRDRALFADRRSGKVGADSAVRLAAGRDGRSDAGSAP